MSNEIIEAQPQQMAVVQQSESTSIMRMISVAMDRPDFDVAKLMQLMEMKERFDATEAKKAYVVAMAEFKKNSPEIYKDKNVAFSGTSYSHATLGGICEVVIESLARHGISHRWDTAQPGSGMIVVKCILTHNMGHSESTQLEAPPDNSGKKNTIQQLASTVTYLQRYTLLAACGLATKDAPDDDGRGASASPEEKAIVRAPIGGKAFEKAIAAVKEGTYTASDINKYYALTADQQTVLDDATKESK